MENNNSKRMLTLTSSDGQEFQVTEAVAKESQMLRDMIEGDCIITNIPLTNADSKILKKVLQYCQKHAEEKEKATDVLSIQEASSSSAPPDSKASNEDLNEWDKEFMKDADLDMLYDLILACNYLNVEGLLNLTAQYVANHIKGKSVEQIREEFDIKADFTPEEEAEIRKESQWAFE